MIGRLPKLFGSYGEDIWPESRNRLCQQAIDIEEAGISVEFVGFYNWTLCLVSGSVSSVFLQRNITMIILDKEILS